MHSNTTPLTQEMFEDFKQRLHDLRRGNLVDKHCTSFAIVQVRQDERVYGFDPDYGDNKVIICPEDDHAVYNTPLEWFESLDEDAKQEVNEALAEDEFESFTELTESQQWDFVSDFDGLDITCWKYETKVINTHLTMESAKEFIENQRHNYPNAYTYVDSQWRVPEYNVIIDAILDGKIGFINPEEKP